MMVQRAPELHEVVEFLDTLLDIASVPDYPGALNGLQFESRSDVRRVAVAVDASLETIEKAISGSAQLLVVHHGLFWGGAQRITGRFFSRFERLIGGGLAVYSAHLPLDLHPTLGNNVLLARALGLTPSGGFAHYQGVAIGVTGESDVATADIAARLGAHAHAHGGSIVVAGDLSGRRTRRWAICSGAGASSDSLREASSLGVDTLIVGEGPHHTAVEARELGIAVLYGGHYATETFGVCAVGAELERRFALPWSFIEAPSGL